MSSYNRMLIHRVAAFFGMEHNVDPTQHCVIAAVTKATRVPDVKHTDLVLCWHIVYYIDICVINLGSISFPCS